MSARVLITGGGGFAGGHLVDACLAAGDEVHALVRPGRAATLPEGARAHEADLRDPEATRRVVAAADPEQVFHLAALASVGHSWQEPSRTMTENVTTAFNLLDAVRGCRPDARVVVAGSGEVYGPPASLPVTEAAPLRPQNPYAVSKAAVDLVAGFFADAHALHVVRARAFNHAGPRQPPLYAAASFTRQLAEGLAVGADPIRIVTGNPEPRRDYTDVRDVVRAYRLLAAGAPPGAYNVCSGRAVSVRELVSLLAAGAGVEVEHEVDPRLVRAHDVMEIRGDHSALTATTGWEPEIPLERTLADAVEWWSAEIAAGRA